MVFGVYTVFDKVASEGGPPFTAKNDEVAKRAYQNLVNSQKINYVDFELVFIGTYDPDTLLLKGSEQKKIDIYFTKGEINE